MRQSCLVVALKLRVDSSKLSTSNSKVGDINPARSLRGLAMTSDLNLNGHIKSITKSAYYHLKNISRIRVLMSQQYLEILDRAFAFSRLGCCNSDLWIRQLQFIQSAAARDLTEHQERRSNYSSSQIFTLKRFDQ